MGPPGPLMLELVVWAAALASLATKATSMPSGRPTSEQIDIALKISTEFIKNKIDEGHDSLVLLGSNAPGRVDRNAMVEVLLKLSTMPEAIMTKFSNVGISCGTGLLTGPCPENSSRSGITPADFCDPSQTNRKALVLVMDTGDDVKEWLSKRSTAELVQCSWILPLYFTPGPEDDPINDLRLFASRLPGLSLTSRLYGVAIPNAVNERDANLGVDIYEMYRVPKGPLVVNLITSTSALAQYQVPPPSGIVKNIWARRSNLRQAHLRVGVAQSHPFSFLTVINGTKDWDGIMVGLFRIMADNLNLTYTFYDTVDGTFGVRSKPDGSWTGLISMLMNDTIDVAVTDMVFSTERAQAVDFSTEIYRHHNYLFMLAESDSESRNAWKAFFDVFELPLWLASLGLFGFIGVVLYWTFRSGAPHPGEEQQPVSLPSAIASSMATMVVLPICRDPINGPGRIVLLTTLLAGYTLFTAYNAGLVSQLAVKSTTYPITSLEDLVDNPEFSLVLLYGAFFRDYFNGATQKSDRTAHILWQRMMQAPEKSLLRTMPEIEQALLNDKYLVYLDGYLSAVGEMKSVPCQIVPVSKAISQNSVGWMVQKGSPYKDIFDFVLAKLLMRGLMDRQTKVHSRPENVACATSSKSDTQFNPLTFNALQTPFLILAFGVFLSLVLCLIELLVKAASSMNLMRRGQNK